MKAFLAKIRETIRKHCSQKQESLIHLLNPMIRGWADYHRHIVAKEMYSSVDRHIWQALWRWARRRHPNKPRKWVREKYFRNLGHRNWVFATQTQGKGSEPKLTRLRSASETRIVRHIKVRSDANPFDPAWDAYFERRT